MKRSMRHLERWLGLMVTLLVLGGPAVVWAQNAFPATGDVLIGTTTSALNAQLTVGAIHPSIGWRTSATGDVYRWTLRSDMGNAFTLDNTSAILMTVAPNGHLGLGTATLAPSAQLTVGAIHPSIGWRSSAAGNQIFRWTLRNDLSNSLTLDDTATIFIAVTPAGNVGIGTMSPTTKLHVAGDAQVDGNLAAKYQDIAEWVQASSPLTAGTVVVIDPQRHDQILPASQSYDTRVAGVVSARPGLLLGEAGEGKAKVASSGRVKVKVDASYGLIAVGDLLVTSATPGHAMRSTPVNLGGTMIHRPGTLLGKALEPLEEGQGEILVLLTLQ